MSSKLVYPPEAHELVRADVLKGLGHYHHLLTEPDLDRVAWACDIWSGYKPGAFLWTVDRLEGPLFEVHRDFVKPGTFGPNDLGLFTVRVGLLYEAVLFTRAIRPVSFSKWYTGGSLCLFRQAKPCRTTKADRSALMQTAKTCPCGACEGHRKNLKRAKARMGRRRLKPSSVGRRTRGLLSSRRPWTANLFRWDRFPPRRFSQEKSLLPREVHLNDPLGWTERRCARPSLGKENDMRI